MTNDKAQMTKEIKEILKKNSNVKYAFLFGSIIKKPLPESDVDIVLVKQAAPELVLKAFSLGIILCAKKKKELKEDYFRNLRLREDGKNLQRLKIARMKRRS